MTRVLIIGLSTIAQRRVLPALDAIASVTGIDIASRSKPMPSHWPKKGHFYQDYTEALSASHAGLVYISLPNSDHVAWIKAALRAGKHVVVDKPATLTLAEAAQCCEEADRRGLVLAEATVFSFHAGFPSRAELSRMLGPLTHISADFIIPPLPPENFRNHAHAGGGSLADMGPYAAAVSRLFCSGTPVQLCAAAAPGSTALDVDLGFSLLAKYTDGLRYTGHFSFESEYQNRLSFTGKSGAVVIERVFSPPPDQQLTWQTRRKNVVSEEKHSSSDSFRLFLEAVLTAIAEGNHKAFTPPLLQDAAFRDQLASSLA